jgi:hypothetical protein
MTTTEFEDAKEGLRATGASVSAIEVVEALDRHGREERELLERYGQYVERSGSSVSTYLVGLIMEEESRHHRMLEEMANTIAWGDLDNAQHRTLPRGGIRSTTPDRGLRSETRSLIRHERRDLRQIRTLGRRLRRYGDVPLWTLLIELMRLDTEKHVSILQFIEKDNRPRRLHRLWARTSARIRRAWTT